MNYFSICFDGFCLVLQGILHIIFAGRLTGKRVKLWHIVTYILSLFLLEWSARETAITGIFAIGMQVIILYSINRWILENQNTVSWTAAILAIYISQLSFGLVNSLEAMLFPPMIGDLLLYVALILAAALAFMICICCYVAVLKISFLKGYGKTPYVGLLLFPGFFFLVTELYILHTSYSSLSLSLSIKEVGKNTALLFLQLLGLGAMICTLYAYRHTCCGFQIQSSLASFRQAARAQEVYIAEAQLRYEQTAAFRHDIKNHLSVLDGLLRMGKAEESQVYLRKLETIASSLSFPYQTGNPVVDILLGEKLGIARVNGISTDVSLILPKPCKVDDVDLCVVFANALDNALNACLSVRETAFIRITGERQGDFYLLEFENTCSSEPLSPMGTGLFNIKTVAEKYHGTILAEKAGFCFHLTILLNIS